MEYLVNTAVCRISLLYHNHGKSVAKKPRHYIDIPRFNETVTTLRNAAPLEPWNLTALVLHVCYFVIKRGY